MNPSSWSLAGKPVGGDDGRYDVDGSRVLVGLARVVVTDTHTRQGKSHRIRVLAEINPQLTVKRHRGARAARDQARSISCVQHPSLTHGHMKHWLVQVP